MGNNKFSFGLAALVAVGVGLSAPVLADPISDTFATGDTLTAAKMNSIKNSVNSLYSGTGSCGLNAGDAADGMVRVGSVCVDKYQARVDLTGCPANGQGAGCATKIAASTSTGTAAEAMSWAQAARACANAGKRLLTPGEWLAAFTAGAFTPTTDSFDFVDGLLTTQDPTVSAINKAQGGYIGKHSGATPAGDVHFLSNVDYDAAVANTATFSWHFRCGR